MRGSGRSLVLLGSLGPWVGAASRVEGQRPARHARGVASWPAPRRYNNLARRVRGEGRRKSGEEEDLRGPAFDFPFSGEEEDLRGGGGPPELEELEGQRGTPAARARVLGRRGAAARRRAAGAAAGCAAQRRWPPGPLARRGAAVFWEEGGGYGLDWGGAADEGPWGRGSPRGHRDAAHRKSIAQLFACGRRRRTAIPQLRSRSIAPSTLRGLRRPRPRPQWPAPRRQPRGATTLHDSAGPRAAQTQGGGGFAREVVPASGLKLGPCLSDDAHKVASSVLKAGNGTRDTAPRPRRIRTTDGIDDAFAVDEAGLVI